MRLLSIAQARQGTTNCIGYIMQHGSYMAVGRDDLLLGWVALAYCWAEDSVKGNKMQSKHMKQHKGNTFMWALKRSLK